jgi:crotonobetainyl-CoA:carnitine CoA-transferase CaiB-like acyl-CoA transferase
MGNSHPSLFPYEPLMCADGELVVTAGNNGQFRKLVEVLGVPELADDPRFSRNEDRTANRDELRPLLAARLTERTALEWFDAIIGVLAALHSRADTGKGQHIEVNLLSSALSGLVNHSSGYVAGGTVPFRMGNAHPSLFPYEPLPTSDGELIVIAGNDGQFRKLCEVLNLPDLPEDPRFLRNQDRTANREALRPLLVERLSKRTKDEWFRELLAAGVPCAPINTVDGGVALAQELGLDPVVTVGGIPGVRNPITFSETPARYELPPPGLDEHGEEIRRWLTS